ncbi:MAG: DUF2147 domain-containing protein [Tidjanibacter sp.]|nr:DUF2147 domain-containing protein [Tidjanibacter sp.]
MKKIITTLTAILLGIMALSAQSQFVGKWTTIDDKTEKPAGIVEIYKGTDGLYYGKLVDTYGPDKSAVGTMIVKGMSYKDGKLVGGKVYDPDSGKTYYCTIKYDGAKKALNLRGSLDKKGLLGRTQTWIKK